MAALIYSVMDTKDKVPFFVNQAEAMGIEILPPDVNLSDHEFMVVEGNIRFGLDAVKGVGFAAVEAIKRAREDGHVHVAVGLLRARRRAHGQQALDRGADQVRRVRVHQGYARGHARRARRRAGRGPALTAGRADGPGLDLRPLRRRSRSATPFAAPSYPPIPTGEFDRTELLAIEKESIGIFISEHPLKRVREALKVKTDCAAAEVMDQRDGEWVKVGGMITESKKIRTRTGTPMMFATLDDIDGAVELVVFEKALAAAEGVIAADAIVLVRGRVDHKEAGKVCMIVQDVDPFEPTEKEIDEGQGARRQGRRPPRAAALRRSTPRSSPSTVMEDLRELFGRYPGETEVVLEMDTRTGLRRLKLGEGYKVQARNAGLRAELDACSAAPSPPCRAKGSGTPSASQRSVRIRRLAGASFNLAARPAVPRVAALRAHPGGRRPRRWP